MKKTILKECLRIAREKNNETHPEWKNYPHYAFIVQYNRIIEWSTNRTGPPVSQNGYDPKTKIHAEFDAYRKSKGILERNDPFECVNIRLNRQSELKLSAPCKVCISFLQKQNCSVIYYTTNEETIEKHNGL